MTVWLVQRWVWYNDKDGGYSFYIDPVSIHFTFDDAVRYAAVCADTDLAVSVCEGVLS